MDEQGLRRDVLTAFEFAHERADFVNPVGEALEGVTAEEAMWRPSPDGKGIWDMVLHMAAWTENGVERIRTGKHSRPAEGAWPPPPSSTDEAAWQSAKTRLNDALAALRATIESMLPAALLECSIQTWSPLIEIQARFIHNAYHLGQITKLRELRGNP